MAYAEGTTVPIEKSLAEINRLLKKAGANRIAQVEDSTELAIQCFLRKRLLRFHVMLPPIDTIPRYTGNHRHLTDAQRNARMEQKHMQRARALLLVIKAKLESVESGVETFDEAFLANVVMADGQTVAQKAIPQIASSYSDGNAPTQLLITAQ